MKAPIQYAFRLLAFAFEANPWLYLAVVVSLASVAIEVAAMSSLLPLSSLAFEGKIADANVFVRALRAIDVEPSFRSLGFLFLGLFAARLVTHLVAQSLGARFGRRLLAQLATRAFSGVIRAEPLDQVERHSIGHYITLAGDEAFRASMIVISILQLIAAAVLGTLYFFAIAWYSMGVGIGVMGFLIAAAVAMAGTFRRSRELGKVQIEQARTAGSVFLDALNGLRTVRALRAEAFVVEAYSGGMSRYVHTLFTIDFLNLLARTVPALLLVAVAAVALAMAGGEKSFDAPWALTLAVLLLRFFPVVGQAVQILLRLVSDTKAAQDILGAITGMQTGTTAVPYPERIRSIRLRSLDFSHGEDKTVLKGFDASFEAGKTYALVGPSGSGKSTLFDLLLGLREPDAGSIEINGRTVSTAELAGCRDRMVLVTQHAVVFNDTVASNVAFGAEVDAATYADATARSAFDEVEAGLPEGRDTVLAYQGSNLSGGQRQRLSLARGLVRDSDVLLLDEPTTGLDASTRDAVAQRITEAYRDRIVIWATHDPELIRRLDAVVTIPQVEAVVEA